MKNNSRKPSYPFRVDVDADIWLEMDRISREERYTKRTMVEEGLQLWIDRHNGREILQPRKEHAQTTQTA